ncbi:MAG: hypothetical protein R2809_07270 [Flavobacteriales bacterium]
MFVKDSLRAIVPLAPDPFPLDTANLCYGYGVAIVPPSINYDMDYEWNYSPTLEANGHISAILLKWFQSKRVTII